MAKLDTSIGSASKTAPALHFGYQHNFTNNFSLEAGLLWFFQLDAGDKLLVGAFCIEALAQQKAAPKAAR